jgi:serine/threonine protein kinase
METETETAPDDTEPVKGGDYVLESKLGEGSFSTVWKAEHKLSGQVVALKQVYLSRLNRHLRSCLDCELNFLSSVNHPNIVRLFEVFQVRGIIVFSFFSALVAYSFRFFVKSRRFVGNYVFLAFWCDLGWYLLWPISLILIFDVLHFVMLIES